MITVDDIRWGSYSRYEGPWTLGEQRYELPSDATDREQILAVITATEGGGYDVVNMYDVCLWTVGIIQWCNRAPQHSVDDLFSVMYVENPSLLDPVTNLAAERGYRFGRHGNKHRFIDEKHNVVDTPQRQQRLYFRGASGEKGSWVDEEDRVWAKRWCAATAQVWENPVARDIQLAFTLSRLVNFFAYKSGKTLLESMPDTPVGHAWRALYLSFASNNPARASDAISASLKETAGWMEPWTESWLANMAWHMTFGAGIAIYPNRYDKIRPLIERFYGVDLPDTSSALTSWMQREHISSRWLDVVELQRALLVLGYDIGPTRADGIFGPKTRQALLSLERDAGVERPDGIPDRKGLQALEAQLEKHAVEDLAKRDEA